MADPTRMTLETPIMIPSSVKKVRSLWARNESQARPRAPISWKRSPGSPDTVSAIGIKGYSIRASLLGIRSLRPIRSQIITPASGSCLPDPAGLSTANHRHPLLASEGLLEFRHVGNGAVDPEAIDGMWIGLRLQALRFRGFVRAPDLAPAEEELLRFVEAAEFGHGLAREVVHERDPGEPQPAVIGCIFAQSEFAVHVDAALHGKAGIFVDQALLAPIEGFGVSGGPPVVEIAFRIELAAFVVESMGEFVPDDSTDGAVIDGIRGLFVEERRLQDARREVDVIHLRVVIRVDRGRRHAPFEAIHRFADLLQFAVDFEFVGSQ